MAVLLPLIRVKDLRLSDDCRRLLEYYMAWYHSALNDVPTRHFLYPKMESLLCFICLHVTAVDLSLHFSLDEE